VKRLPYFYRGQMSWVWETIPSEQY